MANDPVSPNSNSMGAAAEGQLPKEFINVMAMVRQKLRDYPELNRLVSGKETSDRALAFAILEALDDFNTTPPLIDTYGIVNFPSISLLINGTIINILESVGLLQTRNHMVYSDGSIQVGTSDKTPMLMQWIGRFQQTYEAKKFRLKQALNLNGALRGRGVSSEYTYVNGIFDAIDSE